MSDLIELNDVGTTSLGTIQYTENVLTNIETSSQIALYPLYGGSYAGDDTIVLPISPADLMFNEDSNSTVISLINYGELNVGMNRKLATWSIDSFFPIRTTGMGYYSNDNQKGYTNNNRTFKYWFDISKKTKNPYEYCKQLMEWKDNQTPLVFMFETWDGYYNCQIKRFNYGRKDPIGNIYYQLDFQEYKEYTAFTNSSATTDYSSDTYYPAEGENILQICRKLYGDSDKYKYFMNLNNMKTVEIVAGQAYKVR